MWVRGHSRSLKMVQFESLGRPTVSYSLSIAISEISMSNNGVTLKTRLGVVQGH